MTLPVVIFDLDGTPVDSEPDYYEAGRRPPAAHGVTDFGWEQHGRHGQDAFDPRRAYDWLMGVPHGTGSSRASYRLRPATMRSLAACGALSSEPASKGG